jgi:hypothetical protein
LFETTARKLLSENPRVEFLYGTTVTGLLFDGEHGGGDGAAAAAATAAAAAGTGHGTADKLGKAVTGGSAAVSRLVFSSTAEP